MLEIRVPRLPISWEGLTHPLQTGGGKNRAPTFDARGRAPP